MIEIIDSFQPIDENEVAKLESQLGASFPESFIEFYRVRNGGRLSQIVFEDNHGNFNELEFFLPIATSTRNPVVAHTYICDEFPEGFYPVLQFAEGQDVQYLLSFNQTNFGRIVVFDISSGYERAIVDSFDTLLKGLTNNPSPYFWTACKGEPWKSAEWGDWEKIQGFIDGGFDLNALEEKENGLPLISVAAANRRLSVLKKLLDAGADVHKSSRTGMTALHLAAYVGRSPDIMNALLQKGADIDSKDEDGNTPLHMVSRHQVSLRVFEWLVQNGADFSLLNNQGLSCKQMYENRLQKYPEKKLEWQPYLELMDLSF